MKKPPELYFLLFLHFLLGYNGLMGGGLLILEPNGSLLGMRLDWLNNSPFSNYLIPGILLMLFCGFLPIITMIGLMIKPSWKWVKIFNIYSDKYWAWAYSLFCGIMLITWISVQLIITQYFWLQPVMIGIGLLIIIFTMMPRIISYYSSIEIEEISYNNKY